MIQVEISREGRDPGRNFRPTRRGTGWDQALNFLFFRQKSTSSSCCVGNDNDSSLQLIVLPSIWLISHSSFPILSQCAANAIFLLTTMPPKRQSQDPSQKSEEMSDTSSRRLNGSKTKPTSKRSALDSASGRDKAPTKKAARKPASKPDVNAAKKVKRSTKKDKDGVAMQTSSKAPSNKRKPKPPAGSARAAFAVKEEDISSEEEDDGCAREYESLPSVSMIGLQFFFCFEHVHRLPNI